MTFLDALATGLPMRRRAEMELDSVKQTAELCGADLAGWLYLKHYSEAQGLSPWMILDNGVPVTLMRDDYEADDWEVMRGRTN